MHEDGSVDLAWYDTAGAPMVEQWGDPALHTLQMLVNGAWLGGESVLVVLQTDDDAGVTLPRAPGVSAYTLLWDSAWERPQPAGEPIPPGPVAVEPRSMQVYAVTDET